MKWLRMGAMLTAAAWASYGQAGFAKEGDALTAAKRSGQAAWPGLSAKRLPLILEAQRPDPPAARRGPAAARIYREASPSVVLIITDDGLGSGVLVSADGMILTNLHVVGEETYVSVAFKPAQEGGKVDDQNIHVAKVIRRDEVADLALIQIKQVPAGIVPLKITEGDGVEIGSDVHAIGHPTGATWSYTQGIVSQIRRDYDWTLEDNNAYRAGVIQTQTPINPGNSGGPLLDDALEVVGINSFTAEGEGMNFAVAAEDIRAFLARKEDRLREAAPRKTQAAAAEACEPKALDSMARKDPAGTLFIMDDDCDGEKDSAVLVPDDNEAPTILILDTDEDGKIDTLLYDDDRDDYTDRGLYDTDGDGKSDLRGWYRNREHEPYRVESLRE